VYLNLRISRCGARAPQTSVRKSAHTKSATRARLSAFHDGSCRQGFRPLGATPGQASWDVAGRSILYCRSNRRAKISRSYTGVTRARLSQSRERTSRTGHSAGQHDARSCPGAECIVPPAGTALAPPLGIPSRQASLVSEIRTSEYPKWRQMSMKERPPTSLRPRRLDLLAHAAKRTATPWRIRRCWVKMPASFLRRPMAQAPYERR
jgi:hypothetical protein